MSSECDLYRPVLHPPGQHSQKLADRQSQLPWWKGGGSVEQGPGGQASDSSDSECRSYPAIPLGAHPRERTQLGSATWTVSRGTCCKCREVTDSGLWTWLLVPGPTQPKSVSYNSRPGSPGLSSHGVENKNTGRGDSAKENSPTPRELLGRISSPGPLRTESTARPEMFPAANTTGVRSAGSGRCSGRRAHGLLATHAHVTG